MRTIFAVAVVLAVVISAHAQAPSTSSLPGPTISASSSNGRTTEVRITFADGSVLRADNMVDANPPAANTFSYSQATGEMRMLENGVWKPVPSPTEFVLSGNVRLRFGGR